MKKLLFIILFLFLLYSFAVNAATLITSQNNQSLSKTSSVYFYKTYWSLDGTIDNIYAYIDFDLNPVFFASTASISNLNTGILTPSQITAISSGSDVGSGYVGYVQKSSIAQGSAITLTSTQWSDITSITVPAGDWHIYGMVCFTGGAITGTLSQMAITTTSGNSATGVILGDNSLQISAVSTATSDQCLTVTDYRVNSASGATYYLKALENFTVGTAKAYGRISSVVIR